MADKRSLLSESLAALGSRSSATSSTPTMPTINVGQTTQTQDVPAPGLIDKFVGFLDNIWTDDLGGNTKVLEVAGNVAGNMIFDHDSWYAKVDNAKNQALSWGVSALPLGIDTFDWDTAGQVSPGQAALANTSWAMRGFNDAASSQMNANGRQRFDDLMRPFMGSLLDDDFDITKKDDRDNLGYWGNTYSGITDGANNWFLDPGVILGKGVKVMRFGSEAMNIAGVTRKTTNIQRVQAAVEGMADEALEFAATTGKAGRENKFNVIGSMFAKGNYDELMEQTWLDGSYKTHLASVGSFVTDERTGILLGAAGAGSQKHLLMLRQEAASVADALENFARPINAYEHAMLAAPTGTNLPVILPDLLEANARGEAVLLDLERRDAALKNILGLFDEVGAVRPIQDLGSFDVKAAKLSAVWNAGKAGRHTRGTAAERIRKSKAGKADDLAWDRQADYRATADDLDQSLAAGRITPEAHAGMRAAVDASGATTPGAVAGSYERVFQASANFRKVRIWDWINGERQSYWATVRGIDDGDGVREVDAILRSNRVIWRDKAFVAEMRNLYGTRTTTTDRMTGLLALEERITQRLAAHYGVDVDDAKAIVELVQQKRKSLIDHFNSQAGKSRAFGIDPEDGSAIVLSPLMRSQLETKVPMLDFRLMERTIKNYAAKGYAPKGLRDQLVTSLKSGRSSSLWPSIAQFIDEVNSDWKAASLMRLGYTQRNILDGYLRSLAVLGTVPGLAPAKVARGARNTFWHNRKHGGQRVVGKAKEAMESAADDIAELRGMQKQLDGYFIENADALSQHPQMLKSMQDDWFALDAKITQRQVDVDRWADIATTGRKRFIGDDEAFTGPLGPMYRKLASNEQTQRAFLDSRATAQSVMMKDEFNWTLIAPGSKQYWDESARAAEQVASDPLGMMAVRGSTPTEMADWLRGPGKSYAKEMGLDTFEKRAGRATHVHDMVHAYWPDARARALVAGDSYPTGTQLRALLGGREDLSPVHGRAMKFALEGDRSLRERYQKLIDGYFKYLGNLPESTLTRQPFYNEVWKREFKSLSEMAKRQGLDIDDVVLIERINAQAHRSALRATNETLFTISRYSNPAAVLKFLVPFFPAWENAIRVWSGIVARDPSVFFRAGIAWNVPNALGMVVDDGGNPVEQDKWGFLDGSKDQWIVLPKPLNDVFEKWAGTPFKSPKGGWNVVNPGETPFLPDFGPLVQMPIGVVLSSKPDWQAWLKATLGEDAYNKFLPFGEAKSNPLDYLLPTVAKDTVDLLQGEGNRRYLAVAGAMAQTAMIDWYRAGGDPALKPSPERIRDMTNKFYLFDIFADVTRPAPISRMSKYQLQIDYWNALKADPTVPFAQKVDHFLDKFGDEFLPITLSTSKSVAKNLDPTLETWRVLNDYSAEVEQLASYDPASVGVLAATANAGVFDRGVYNWYLEQNLPGTGDTLKSKALPAQYMNDIQVQQMWREYRQQKMLRDDAMQSYGITDIDSAKSRQYGIYQEWQKFKAEMADKYGMAWSTGGPDSSTYQAGLSRDLGAIGWLTANAGFMESDLGQSDVWQQIKRYMDERALAIEAIEDGTDSKAVREMFYAWREQFRYSSVKFAEFFDQFLDTDNLSLKVVTGG